LENSKSDRLIYGKPLEVTWRTVGPKVLVMTRSLVSLAARLSKDLSAIKTVVFSSEAERGGDDWAREADGEKRRKEKRRRWKGLSMVEAEVNIELVAMASPLLFTPVLDKI